MQATKLPMLIFTRKNCQSRAVSAAVTLSSGD
jgi:hypothetical protein